jgi:hypothetical protein
MIQKTIAVKNLACNAVVHAIDVGSLYPTGHLSIFNADSTRITRLPLSLPAFMDATDGTAYANPIWDATSVFDATAATFWFENRDGTHIWGGTVADTTAGDMVLGSVILPNDSTVSVDSAVYIVP